MKGTAHALFRVVTCHRGGHARNKGVTLILSLVINVFVCSVISRWNELYLKVSLETPQKGTELLPNNILHMYMDCMYSNLGWVNCLLFGHCCLSVHCRMFDCIYTQACSFLFAMKYIKYAIHRYTHTITLYMQSNNIIT